jgi:hypothetical protein
MNPTVSQKPNELAMRRPFAFQLTYGVGEASRTLWCDRVTIETESDCVQIAMDLTCSEKMARQKPSVQQSLDALLRQFRELTEVEIGDPRFVKHCNAVAASYLGAATCLRMTCNRGAVEYVVAPMTLICGELEFSILRPLNRLAFTAPACPASAIQSHSHRASHAADLRAPPMRG